MSQKIRVDPQSGTAFKLKKDQVLKIIDVEGEQVADLIAFGADDTAEWLSSGRTIDYANTIYLTAGHLLYSNRSRPMFVIESDDGEIRGRINLNNVVRGAFWSADLGYWIDASRLRQGLASRAVAQVAAYEREVMMTIGLPDTA